MEENSVPELTEERVKRYDLASALTKEVFQEVGIEDIKNYTENDLSSFNCRLYKIEGEREVRIYAEVVSELGLIKIEFSAVMITHRIIEFLERLLSNENASEILSPSVIYELKKRNIDILTLFDLEESEVPEAIKDNTKKIFGMFINNIALFTRASVVDALIHSMSGYNQHFIKELLKEHWAKLGLPRGFNLLTQTELDDVRQYNLDRKRWFIGDKKQLLNAWRFEGLADEADDLRKQYKTAKTRYKQLKHSFELLNKRASREDWVEKWIDLQLEECPALNSKALNSIEEYRPFELAIIHLAELFGYDTETMRKKITQSRDLKKQKAKNRQF